MTVPAEVVGVDTPQGPGRFYVSAAADQHSVLVLGHGAGGGVTAADLELLARTLPAIGATVVRFEQPWRTAGRKVGSPPPLLDEAWLAAVSWLAVQPWARGALFLGGRSAGARVACRTADALGAAGVVCLAFPLHLPGRPEKSRAPELLTPQVPRLVLQGTKDAFGSADEVRAVIGAADPIELIELPGADHSFRLPARAPFTPADLRSTVVTAVGNFVAGISSGGAR